MCEELNDELGIGEKLAEELVEHLIRMNAETMIIPVSTDEKGIYEVIVSPKRDLDTEVISIELQKIFREKFHATYQLESIDITNYLKKTFPLAFSN